MKLEINNIITKIENQERLKDKEIENILNNVEYVVVYNFTNSIGHLTNYGKNEMVKQYKTEILAELYGYLNEHKCLEVPLGILMAKYKICKNSNCKKKFTPERQFQVVCSFECAIEYSKQLRDKRESKKKTDAKKEYTKTKKEFYAKDINTLKVKAQNAFNRYIRRRDKNLNCISCGCKVEKGDASHFFSVGSHSAVRFNTDNCHLSCYKCNRFLHGNLVPYKPALIAKIGQERYDKLEEQSKDIKHYTNEYYKRIIQVFNKKSKRI